MDVKNLLAVNIVNTRGFRSSAKISRGVLQVRLSRFLSKSQREATLTEFKCWAEGRLRRSDMDFVSSRPKFIDGELLQTVNKSYNLRVLEVIVLPKGAARASATLSGNQIFLKVLADLAVDERKNAVRELVRMIIAKDQQAFLEEVLSCLNERSIAEKFKKCRFSRQDVRFGSCSRRGNIYISNRLLFAPREIFEYVCIHELAHLKHFNHSKRFWGLVEKADPDYKLKEKWLRENGWML